MHLLSVTIYFQHPDIYILYTSSFYPLPPFVDAWSLMTLDKECLEQVSAGKDKWGIFCWQRSGQTQWKVCSKNILFDETCWIYWWNMQHSFIHNQLPASMIRVMGHKFQNALSMGCILSSNSWNLLCKYSTHLSLFQISDYFWHQKRPRWLGSLWWQKMHRLSSIHTILHEWY